MKVYKVTIDVWVVGDTEAAAIEHMMEDLDYLSGLDDAYLNVVGYAHPDKAVLDEDATDKYQKRGFVGYGIKGETT